MDDAFIAEERQRRVARGEADGGLAPAEPPPQRLRREVVALARELLEHLEPLARGAHPLLLQQTGQASLRFLRHVRILAHMIMRTILVCATALLLAAPAAAASPLPVVASTNVYGD